MESPWGDLPVSDAHVHFFSHRFFSTFAESKSVPVESLASTLGWQIPGENPEQLAAAWAHELDRHGVNRAILIASVPGDQNSVIAAVSRFPDRFFGFMMVNPLAEGALDQVQAALSSGQIRGLCFFPAMHRYSIQDDHVTSLLNVAAEHPGVVVFVHCGVLTVGIRRKLGLPSHFDMRFSNPIDLHAVALRYSHLQFVVPHFGAGYFRETLMLCDLCPNVWLDTSSSNSWMRYEEASLDLRTVFRRAIDVIGPERLLFGTDSSFFPRGWNAEIFEAQAKALYELGLKADVARMIFHDNLARLL